MHFSGLGVCLGMCAGTITNPLFIEDGSVQSSKEYGKSRMSPAFQVRFSTPLQFGEGVAV